MPNWKKVIISGSNAALSSITASNVPFGEGTENLLAINPTSNGFIQIPIDDLPIAVTEYTNGGNNRVITSTGTDGINAETYFTYNSSDAAVRIVRPTSPTTGLNLYPGITPIDNNVYITPYGNANTIFIDGNLTISDQHRISFSDVANTFIRADYETPENLEIHADKDVRAFPDEAFAVVKSAGQGYQYPLYVTATGTFLDEPLVGIGTNNPTEALVVRGNIVGGGFLRIEGDATVGGQVSASGKLFANIVETPVELSPLSSSVVVYDTASGEFLYEPIDGLIGVPDLQSVTEVGNQTGEAIISKNTIIAHESNDGIWGGYTTEVDGKSGFIKTDEKIRTHVTPQPSQNDRFTFVGHKFGTGQGTLANLKTFPDNDLIYTPTVRLSPISTGYQFTVIGSITTTGGGGGIIDDGGGSGIELTANPGIYFYNTDASASVSGAREIVSASALIKFNTTSSALQFFAGSTNEELKEVLFVSRSGDSPRIGIGTNTPINTLDFIEKTDSPEGTEILLRGSRTTKGAEIGDNAGKITFSIDSGSYQNIKSSGSISSIHSEVTTISDIGVTGDLIFSTTNSPKLPPTEVFRISNSHPSALTGSLDITENLIVDGNTGIRGTLTLPGITDVSASIAEKRNYPFNIGTFGGEYYWDSTDSNERILHGFVDGPTAGGTQNTNEFGTTTIGTLNTTQEVLPTFNLQYSGLYSPEGGIPHIKAWGKSSDADLALASASIGMSLWSLDTEPANGASGDQTVTLRAQVPPIPIVGEGSIYYFGNGMEASGSIALDPGTFYFVTFDLSGSINNPCSLKMNFNLWLE